MPGSASRRAVRRESQATADIAAKIELAFADPDLHARLRDGARATALNYGWDHVGARYIALLEQVQASKDAVSDGTMAAAV